MTPPEDTMSFLRGEALPREELEKRQEEQKKAEEEKPLEEKLKGEEKFEEEKEEPPKKKVSDDNFFDRKIKEKLQNNKEEEEEEEEKEEPKRKSKGRREQMGDLRRDRDAAIKRAEEAEAKLKELEASASPDAKEILNFLQEKRGPFNSDSVDYIKNIYEAAEERDKIKTEFEAYKREKDILSSDEWEKNYAAPYNNAVADFDGVIANVDSDGKVAHPALIQRLHSALFDSMNNNGGVVQTQVKGILDQFAKIYEQETEEIYVKPALTEVVSAMRSILRADAAGKEAFQNWEESREERRKRVEADKLEQNQKLNLEAKKKRQEMALDAFNGFEFDEVEDIFEDEVIESTYKEVYDRNEQQFNDPTKAIPYGELLTLQVKGFLFNDLLKEVIALRKQIDSKTRDRPVRTNSRLKKPEIPEGERQVGGWLKDANPLTKNSGRPS